MTTGDLRVMCDGPHFSKHPRVYLTMVDDAEGKPSFVVCPYCSRVYEYDARLAMPGSH
ncbi:MAG TPA: zinc-finger domain-containing protein [Alphaproteobacteria bacterium]|nr:zinc-finger domain-containing protein [Alphaproteobacteria bacterium]